MSGFFRVAAAVPEIEVADPFFNVTKITELYRLAAEKKASAVVFPELSVTGSTCGDLFEQKLLLDSAKKALSRAAEATSGYSTVMIIGLPWLEGYKVYNASAVCQNGKVLGITVQKFVSSARNSSGRRCFSSAENIPFKSTRFNGCEVPFGTALLFSVPGFSFAIDFGNAYDSLASQAPLLAASGAQIIFTLGAEGETAVSAAHRRAMIKSESSRLTSGYVYSGAGVSESTGEQLFSGHALIASEGKLLAENRRFERSGSIVYADINPSWIDLHRRVRSSFSDAPQTETERIVLEDVPYSPDLCFAGIEKNPFVPEDPELLKERCREIFAIQASALAKRFNASRSKRMVIGLSGGLDSTQALLAAVQCCDLLGLPRNTICAVTMPGFGTTTRTRGNAEILAECSGAELRTIPINDAVDQHFKDIGHDPQNRNVVYENSQARERTQILMDIANEENAIVIGTGDLSEIALGWSTFNGDHMSMYGINCDIPKTLMRSMVEFYAGSAASELAAVLRDICATPVSPELLPGAQHTENIIGSYELHDFFLWYFIHCGATPEDLEFLAKNAFAEQFSEDEIKRTLEIFIRRFFTQQFKRNASPEGPRTNTVSLGAKNDWCMPSDVSFELWK